MAYLRDGDSLPHDMTEAKNRQKQVVLEIKISKILALQRFFH